MVDLVASFKLLMVFIVLSLSDSTGIKTDEKPLKVKPRSIAGNPEACKCISISF